MSFNIKDNKMNRLVSFGSLEEEYVIVRFGSLEEEYVIVKFRKEKCVILKF